MEEQVTRDIARREQEKSDYQEKIAFTRHSTRQVFLKAHTLDQTILKRKLLDTF